MYKVWARNTVVISCYLLSVALCMVAFIPKLLVVTLFYVSDELERFADFLDGVKDEYHD